MRVREELTRLSLKPTPSIWGATYTVWESILNTIKSVAIPKYKTTKYKIQLYCQNTRKGKLKNIIIMIFLWFTFTILQRANIPSALAEFHKPPFL